MGGLKLWVVLAIVVGGFAVSASAAVGPRGNHTEQVTAVFDGQRVATPVDRTCAGDDGQYRQAVETYAGGVGGDPRLDGAGVLTLTSFTNTTTGRGTAAGWLVVTDVTTHQLRWTAAVQGTITTAGGAVDLKGVLTGVVRGRPNQAGGRIVANFEGIGGGTSLYVGIGFPGTTNPAIIQGGSCSATTSR